jgi:hypothetical protein
MTQEIINIGSTANDGSGDPLRVAFQKINNNFTQLFSTGFGKYQSTTFDNSVNQVIFEVPAALMTQATFQVNSANPSNNTSQNIVITASIQNDATAVKWTGHSTIVINSVVVSGYEVIVDNISGNVQLLVSPAVNGVINHLISAQVEVSDFVAGMALGIESDPNTVLITQNNIIITTEQPV